jgi:hypothetical protein
MSTKSAVPDILAQSPQMIASKIEPQNYGLNKALCEKSKKNAKGHLIVRMKNTLIQSLQRKKMQATQTQEK